MTEGPGAKPCTLKSSPLNVGSKVKQFIDAVMQSVKDENWYAALGLALLMPDICGKLEDPAAKSQKRYVDWYNHWMLPKYSVVFGDGTSEVFLTGRDCYALRCAFSHEGRDEISDQNAREVLTRFIFRRPHPHHKWHCNRFNDTLQLQVDIFAKDICDSTKAWLQQASQQGEVAQRIAELIEIRDVREGLPGFVIGIHEL